MNSAWLVRHIDHDDFIFTKSSDKPTFSRTEAEFLCSFAHFQRIYSTLFWIYWKDSIKKTCKVAAVWGPNWVAKGSKYFDLFEFLFTSVLRIEARYQKTVFWTNCNFVVKWSHSCCLVLNCFYLLVLNLTLVIILIQNGVLMQQCDLFKPLTVTHAQNLNIWVGFFCVSTFYFLTAK